jgi:hypothetical protein
MGSPDPQSFAVMQCNGFVQSKATGEPEYDTSPLPCAPVFRKLSSLLYDRNLESHL